MPDTVHPDAVWGPWAMNCMKENVGLLVRGLRLQPSILLGPFLCPQVTQYLAILLHACTPPASLGCSKSFAKVLQIAL